MELSELIISLCSEAGPSGFEERAAELAKKYLAPYVDEIRSDAMGNLIAVKRCGRENAKSIMLDAHLDEIGFIVTGYEKGFLRFGTIGGIDPRMLPAAEIKVLTDEPIYGVIDVMPPHALSSEEMEKSISKDKLYIDVGMGEDEVKEKIPLGTPCVFSGGAQMLGDKTICGKALDDRACAAVIIKIMEQLSRKNLEVDVYCLLASQEELGMRGAVVGAYGVSPDYAIALDVTHGDTPDAPKHKTLKMGGGAAVAVGPNMTRAFTNALLGYAKEKEISCQTEVIPGCSGTDAWVIQTSREGIATALVSLPVRYMHSPVETMNLGDAESIVELISGFIAMTGEVC